MADIRGFLRHGRELPERRAVPVRLSDWREVYEPFEPAALRNQASRCMDCGIPFCNGACPLGNIIPDWNDLVFRDRWRDAIERLHATNNFPEFTGRLCPAPCEGACVLGINQDPVTIKQVEVEIIDHAFEQGWVEPLLPVEQTGKQVAVVGSGPAGLAAAQQLTRAGHDVTVYERADRIGGLLRYGIPEFKMEKRHIDRRLEQMRAEGTRFRTGVWVGGGDVAGCAGGPGSGSWAVPAAASALGDRADSEAGDVAGGRADSQVDGAADQLSSQLASTVEVIDASELATSVDALVLACGATQWRDLPIPGRDLGGIYQAMEYLPWANRAQEGDLGADEVPVHAGGKHVVIIGGGDTGADCLGTAHRQGAASVSQLEIMARPPEERSEANPWPTYPMVFRVSSAHEEGGERLYSVNTEAFMGDSNGNVRALRAHEVELVDGKFNKVEGTDFEIECQLVLLAMGFTGVEPGPLVDGLGLTLDARTNVARDGDYATNVDGVWVCGDMGRGQSLIVWAIAEGRACAAAVDAALMGSTDLPRPVEPTDRPLT